MTNKRIYNFFLFMSTLTRSLVEIFSVIFLWDKGYSVSNILLFLLIMYVVGIGVNYFSLVVRYKVVLLISIILYGCSYLFLSIMGNSIINLVIYALMFAFSSYSYHVIRHYLAMRLVHYNRGKSVNKILVIMYSAVILSNILGIYLINRLSMISTSVVIMGLSLVSVIPILKLDNISRDKINIYNVRITKDKVFFSVLEQFKVILMELQPLYLYIFVKSSKYYVGIFNVIINLASLFLVIFIIKRLKKRNFRYINIILVLVLVLKLNIDNSVILLLIAFLEGIGVKIFEKFSLDNLYNIGNNDINSYLLVEELIFFISKSFFMLIFFLFVRDLKIILYICIIGLFLSGFYIKDND